MRVDKFLSGVNILKRRSIAQDMCENGVVSINNARVKSSKEVRVGDIIKLTYLEYTKSYKVLAIPTTKTIQKTKSAEYFEEIFE